MTMRDRFGGATEWYRGAYLAVLGFAQEAARQGHVLHAPARRWFESAVRARTDVLAGLLDQARRDLLDGIQSTAQLGALHDLIDMYRSFDGDIDARFEAELLKLPPSGDDAGAHDRTPGWSTAELGCGDAQSLGTR